MAHFFPEPWLIFTWRGGSYSPEQWLKTLHIIHTTTISGTVTNVSSSTLSDLVVNGMTLKNRSESGFNYSVLDIFNEDKIPINTLAPDATLNYTFSLEDINWVANDIHGVIFVQAPESTDKEVLQAIYIE